VTGGDRDPRGRRRCGLSNKLLELAVEQRDLGVEIDDSMCERAECCLGGDRRLVQSCRIGSDARAERRATARRLANHELLAQLIVSTDDQTIERVQRGAARLDGAVADNAQLADRFDDPGGVLGDHDPVIGEDVARSQLGIDRVALATPPPRVGVRLVDLAHLQAFGAQVARQARGVAPGGLDAER
jgi:hypothetical protein